tara:strand:- start:804 stop:1544 length:741 start_codon:yes stop_codon:yes gene_type:complete
MYKISNEDFLIIGHRGAPEYAPENTTVSFEKAINLGMCAIELDVLLTNDDKVVVFHDYDLKRLAGSNKKIKDLTYDEILKYNISHVWTNKFGVQNIPLLNDVVKFVKKHNVVLNIEIKSTGIFPTKIVDKVVDIIVRNKFENNCIVSSFNPLIIRKIKRINSGLFTSLIWSKDGVPFFLKFYKILYLISSPNGFHPDKKFINLKIINWAKSKGMFIFVFDVNSKDDLNEVKKLNVNGVFTDDPKII